jgi:acylphosphatase
LGKGAKEDVKEGNMHKCVRIIISIPKTKGFLQSVVQPCARQFGIEGVAQVQVPHSIKIVVAGSKEAIDSFIDILHRESVSHNINQIEVEPFVKDRDFRGIFRIIE